MHVDMSLSFCRGQRREETFENVLRNPLTFPSKPAISPEAQDLISKLLVKDPAQRLGTQVSAHPRSRNMQCSLQSLLHVSS